MNRSPRRLLALSTLTLAFAACSGSSSNPAVGSGDDSGAFEAGADGAGEDATLEAGGPDGEPEGSVVPSHDASGPDGSKPMDAAVEAEGDSGVEAASEGGHDAAAESSSDDGGGADASRAEAAAPEASTLEAGSADASNSDGGVADSGPPREAGSGDGSDGASPFVPPVCDGVISPGEYGNQTDGANQQTTPTAVWFMTWSDTTLYLGISGATTSEGAVLYFSDDPAVLPDGGAASNGSTAGFTYDGTNVASLPLHGQLVAYVKDSYNETRPADGAGGWAPAASNQLTVCTSGTTRELSLPWSLVTGTSRPSSFGWLGYLTSSGGYVYGQVPQGNPGMNIGTAATFPWLYLVTDATPLSGTAPFANALQR